MKIASWNVNSLRVRLPQVLAWVNTAQPDILALQETKVTDELFPMAAIEAAGYSTVFSGQKTYNGVAILAKNPIKDVVIDIPGLEDPQRRILGATIGAVRVLNLYVVNGTEVGSKAYIYKLHWLDQVRAYVQAQLRHYPISVIVGDFNIAPDDRDVYDPEIWYEKILCSTSERATLKCLLDLGYEDTFRLFDQSANSFSWWDYRTAGFRRNAGLRIDLILADNSLSRRCLSSTIDEGPRGLKRPSDHAPVIAEFR
jgi:exodeoxyribonuclease-3